VGELAEQLRRDAEACRHDLVKLVLSLASVDAPSGQAEQLAAAADLLAAELAQLGGRLSRTPGPSGDLLELELGPPAESGLLLLGHYDTVWPAGTAAKRPPRVDAQGVIRGPGVFDMRGGIAAAIFALRLLGERQLPVRTTLLLTPDEETGSAGSQQRIIELGLRARCVLVLEPPLAGGALKTSRSGWAVYRVVARGRAAHAGLEPEKGLNAVDEICAAVLAAGRLAAPGLGTTVNAGVISGGTAANMLAAEATALLDVRARSVGEQERVASGLRALRPLRDGATLEVERQHIRPAMERTPAVAAAFTQAREIARRLEIDLREGAAGGTSDANLLAHRGVAVLDRLGPDGGGAHAEDEHVLVSSLVERTALLALLLASLASPIAAPAGF